MRRVTVTGCRGAVVAVSLAMAAPAHAALIEATRLAGIYDTILQARFERASQELGQACPPAPTEACKSLAAVALWWQIVLDPNSRLLDDRFERVATEAIAAAAAWTRREPRRAEAWFYLAGSHAPLVQWRVLRGERLAAAREGATIKDALERVLSLDPTIEDAHFGIGLYRYYADVASLAARILRVLLLLPGGDRARGLREMLQARERGELLRGEADYQLHWLYLWYEGQPARALELLRGLDTRYPSNPVFLQRIAEVQHEYFHDHRASADAWQTLVARVRAGQVSASRLAEVRARIGLASELIDLSEPGQAVEQLQIVIAMRPLEPYSAQALAQLALGSAYDHLGQGALAVAAYNAAVSSAPPDDPLQVRSRARTRLREKPIGR
jgi:tetratricopeptide (TPR) repeat protein